MNHGEETQSKGIQGLMFSPSLLSPAELEPWISRIDEQYTKIDFARRSGGAVTTDVIAPGQRFAPTASSLTLGTIFSDQDFQRLFTAIDSSRAGDWIRGTLGTTIVCNIDQAWVRRQYAPGNYPPLHAPHGWHQDGALGFDFLSYPDGNYPADALLPMITCWIALGPCGLEAPGLEIITCPLEKLLAPTELTDKKVQTRFNREELYRPVMDAGNAVLMRGDTLHRTFVIPKMRRDRTSIELRFFPMDRLPTRLRLKGDRFLHFCGRRGEV